VDALQSFILGIVEGVTEFLPISSTGHLIIASELMGLPQTNSQKAFEVIIQLGAILAVVANYKEKFNPKYLDLWIKVGIAFLPAAGIGFLLHDWVEEMFSVTVVATMFIVGGIVFLLVEQYLKNHQPITERVEDISYKQAIIVGFAQVAALVPGTSRSGSTIVGALLVGISRKASAEFSFLLALPIMVAATGLNVVKHYHEFQGDLAIPLLIGFVTAFVSAYLVIKWFIAFLNRFTFNAFGIYRIVFGLFLFYLLYSGMISPAATA
jgi:undecaprenyl-diphosphatase